MARSDAILKRLLALHPKLMDLSLGRMWRILDALGNPQKRIPPVVHIAGTNGKGSTVATMRAALEAGGSRVHAYTSPHLVLFHERIYLGDSPTGRPIDERALTALLEECEQANGGEPITFFEITTAAAFLAFSRNPADFCLLEVGLGGRLDATNVISRPELCVITPVDYDHQQFLGESIEEIAGEKAGILKSDVTCIVGPQRDAARSVIEGQAERVGAPLLIANQDFQAYEEHGRLVYQDAVGLLDLPLPRLAGHFQIENAGTAIAALRALKSVSVTPASIEAAMVQAVWPARMQRLEGGPALKLLPEGSDLWVDGGHNPAAGKVISAALAELEERLPRPAVLICGMMNTKDPGEFVGAFAGLASRIIALAIPEEANALSAEDLASHAAAAGIPSEIADGLEDAFSQVSCGSAGPVRVLVCGSLYLAGHVLALNEGEAVSGPSGASPAATR